MSDRHRQPQLRDLAVHLAVVCPFTLGTLHGVVSDNPLWLAVGLLPAVVWERWEKRRRQRSDRDRQQIGR